MKRGYDLRVVELARIELASKICQGRIHPQAWFTHIQHWGKVNEPFQ
jgi:predicted amidohydrolase